MSRVCLGLIAAAALSTPALAEEPRTEPEAPASNDSITYVVKLRDLERNVKELQEQIRRQGGGGILACVLPEWFLTGETPGSRVTIRHESEPGRSLRLTKATYFLDEAPIEARDDAVFDGRLEPGTHTLSVVLVYQGKQLGPFTYLQGYKLTVRARREFVVGQSKPVAVTIRSHERAGITTYLAARPAVDFDVEPN